MSQKVLGSHSRLFSGQDPIDRFSRVGLELQQDIGRGSAQAQLVLGELGLRDSQYPPELALGKVKSSHFSDTSSDRFEVRGSPLRALKNIPLTLTHISCILFLLRLWPWVPAAFLYTVQERWGQQSGPRDLSKLTH